MHNSSAIVFPFIGVKFTQNIIKYMFSNNWLGYGIISYCLVLFFLSINWFPFWSSRKALFFDHLFDYSFPLFLFLLIKEKRRKGERITKIVTKKQCLSARSFVLHWVGCLITQWWCKKSKIVKINRLLSIF